METHIWYEYIYTFLWGFFPICLFQIALRSSVGLHRFKNVKW